MRVATTGVAVAPGFVRFAGGCYLLIIALGLFSETLVRGSLVVAGDAMTTAAQSPNCLAQCLRWRVFVT
jgi:hypothetical protein